MAGMRQRSLFGTWKWVHDYGRRVAVEASNSYVKTHSTDVNRGFSRVFGRVKNQLLVTMACVVSNLDRSIGFAQKHSLADPYGVGLVPDPPTPGPRRRTESLA